jgi:heme exporter protein C
MSLSEDNLMHSVAESTKPFCWLREFSPESFYPRVGVLLPWLFTGALVLCALGFYVGFFLVPLEAAQGEAYRIIYIHVPATWVALLIYLLIAFWAGLGLYARSRLAAMVAQSLVPTGATFAFMVLWTGALWGKPAWGTWWTWDVRPVAELVLLLLYLAMLAIQTSIEDARRGDRLVAWLALTGVAVVPTILAAVVFWPTMHEAAEAATVSSSGISVNRIIALSAVAAGFWLYAAATALMRVRYVILERERQSEWIHTVRAGSR